MLIVVADSADELTYVPALEASGYVLHIRELDWYEPRLSHELRNEVVEELILI